VTRFHTITSADWQREIRRARATINDISQRIAQRIATMPTKPETLSTVPTSPSTYDATTRRDDPALALAASLRSGARWQRLRLWFRQRNPLCRDPFGFHAGRPTPASQVHHIIGLTEAPQLAFKADNLASLCQRCHAQVEALERAGKPTAGLFRDVGNIPQRGGAGKSL